MAKKSVSFTCGKCGKLLPKEMTCPRCGFANLGFGVEHNPEDDGTIILSDVDSQPVKRITTGLCDDLFGLSHDSGIKGIAKTSTNLMAGKRGTGKSTLCMQIAAICPPITKRDSMYIFTEQSKEEIKEYTKRFRLPNMNRIRLVDCMKQNRNIVKIILHYRPGIVIIDSLSGLAGDPDTAIELHKVFKAIAVDNEIPFVMICHSTKENDFAGFETLQHDVDGLFVGYMGISEKNPNIRMFQAAGKNRFGEGFARQFYLMTPHGLKPCDEPEEDEE